MKTFISFLVCVLLVSLSTQTRSETYLPGGEISGNLSKIGSPYYVLGDLTVPCNKTLYLQGGVTMIFKGEYALNVYGSIKAMGSDESPILFTVAEGVVTWGGIQIFGNHICPDNMHSRLQYVTIEYASALDEVDMWDHSGGALFISWDDNVHLRNCVFRHNNAAGGLLGESIGGAAIAIDNCSPLIEYCHFVDNTCEKYGGAIGLLDASPQMNHNTFMDNTAGMVAVGGGAAIILQGESNPVSRNDSYLDNLTNGKGGAIFSTDDSDPRFINALFWGNLAEEGNQMYLNDNQSDPIIEYSDFEEGTEGIKGPGSGFAYTGKFYKNFDKEPSCVYTPQGEVLYCLNKCSPCIDAGNPDPQYFDPDGTLADVGAMYFPHEGRYLQDSRAEGEWDKDNSPVWVNTNITVPEEGQLIIDPGVEVFFLNNYKMEVRGSLKAIGTFENRITFGTQERGCNWKGIRFLPESSKGLSSMLVYCIIENGTADGPENIDKMGGGVFIHGNDRVTLSHCIIRNNRTTEMQGNLTGGGGVGILDCSPFLEYNKIIDNIAAEFGGGIGLFNASPIMHHNLVAGNHAGIGGGGICISAGSNPKITNFTLVVNTAIHVGGGALISENSTPTFRNSILYFNSAKYGNEVYINDMGSDPNFYYNDIKGGLENFKGYGTLDYTGDYLNNMDRNPVFNGPAYTLMPISPCIDAGDPYSKPDYDRSRADIGYLPFMGRSVKQLPGNAPVPQVKPLAIHVFPVPAVRDFYIEVISQAEEPAHIMVFDVLGQEMDNFMLDGGSLGRNQYKVDCNEYSPGTYIVVARIGNSVKTKKLTVR